uniref:MATH domain-containing protein n=1 Tax=Caenorhabditis tropicalis TaxID=1561998 RepID=A0A1I7TLF4_9PELO
MPDVYEICKGDTFYRVLEMKSGSSQKGREFMFRNVNWYMQFERRSDMFWLFLMCSKESGNNEPFTVETTIKPRNDIVTGVIEVAFAVNTPLILDECETFLINDSKLSIRRKEKIAYRFNLNKLEKHLADIRNPDNLNGPTIPMENDRVPAVQQQENGDEPTETIEID